jgi:Flp pilus assembly protein TadG
MNRLRRALRDESGSSPVEFVLVGGLLTLLTLAVVQFALAVYVRNVVHDAAVEGAFHAALADTTLTDGEERTATIVSRAIGAGYAQDVVVTEGADVVRVTVRTTIPLIGLLGVERALEVTAHAPAASLD